MLNPMHCFLMNLTSSLSGKRGRRRNRAVETASALIFAESLSERCLLSAVTDAPDGDLEADSMLRTDERLFSETSIQERKFRIRVLTDDEGNLTGSVKSTLDGPVIVFDRNTSELILRVENRGDKGATVWFQSASDSAPFGEVTLPAEGKVPAGKYRRVTVRIPPQVSGEYRGSVFLKRTGPNAAPVEFRVSATVAPEATLLPKVRISADANKVYYDFEIKNTGNGHGLMVQNIRVLDGTATAAGWRFLPSSQSLNVGATGTWRVEADITAATSRNVVVELETNGASEPLRHSLDLNYALERLNPVLIAESATKHTWSANDKTFTVHLSLRNDSIRENLVILPEQIQLRDQFGQAIPLSLVKDGLPSFPITLLPQTSVPLLLTLDTNQVASITDRYRFLQVSIQSNGGDKLLQLDLNAYMDRLVPTIQLEQNSFEDWDRSNSLLRYQVTIRNNSIRDTLNVALASTQLPQHVSITSPVSSSLLIAAGKEASVTLGIFTDVSSEEIQNLRRFAASFFSNDPDTNPAQVIIDASALDKWRDSTLSYGLAVGDYEVTDLRSFSITNEGDRSVTIRLNIDSVSGAYWRLQVKINGFLVHGGVTAGQFVLKPRQMAIVSIGWNSFDDANTYRLRFSLEPLENSLLNARTYSFWR